MAGWMGGGSVSLCRPRATWVSAFGEMCPSGWARLSPLMGLWASRAETNTGKPVSYERTSQPVAQPLVKPSLTTSPASGPVTPDTDRSCWGEKNRRKDRKCVSMRHQLSLLYCQVVLMPTKPPQLWWELRWWEFAGPVRGAGAAQPMLTSHTAPTLLSLCCKYLLL